MTDKIATKPARRMTRIPAKKTTSGSDQDGPQADVTNAPSPRTESKIAMVTRLLERSEGASLDEIVSATGWLLHTTRAALTGLKKKGKVITKGKRDDVTCYFIAEPVA